ncbi:MAG: STAS domain-containing protein [Bryobacteraceae bacterium]
MRTEASRIGRAMVIKLLEPRLGADTAALFKREVSKHLEAGETHIVLDLAELTFMDSSGLGALVGVLKMVGARGDLLVAGTQDRVQTLFRLTHMDSVFRCYATVPEAIDALTPSGLYRS